MRVEEMIGVSSSQHRWVLGGPVVADVGWELNDARVDGCGRPAPPSHVDGQVYLGCRDPAICRSASNHGDGLVGAKVQQFSAFDAHHGGTHVKDVNRGVLWIGGRE